MYNYDNRLLETNAQQRWTMWLELGENGIFLKTISDLIWANLSETEMYFYIQIDLQVLAFQHHFISANLY